MLTHWEHLTWVRPTPAAARVLLTEHGRNATSFEENALAVADVLTAAPDKKLLAALKHEDRFVRRCAALLLGYLARDKKGAVLVLRRALKDDPRIGREEDPLVRKFAKASLARLVTK